MSNIYMGIIVPYSVVFPLFMAVYRCKFWNFQVKIIFIYLSLSAIFNVIAKLTAHSNNMPYLHLYTILEFLVMMCFFRSLEKKKSYRLFFIFVILLFIIVAIGYIFLENSLYKFNYLPRFISGISITVLCIYFLLIRINDSFTEHSVSLFLILMGFLLYYSTCSALFGLSNILLKAPSHMATMIWNIHATFNLVMYLLFFGAFFKLKKR